MVQWLCSDTELAALESVLRQSDNHLHTQDMVRIEERIFGLMIADSTNWATVFDVKRPVVS